MLFGISMSSCGKLNNECEMSEDNSMESVELLTKRDALNILFSYLYSEEEEITDLSMYGEENGKMGYLWKKNFESSALMFLEEHKCSYDNYFQTFWLGCRLYDSNGDFIRSNIMNEYAVDLRNGEVIRLRIYHDNGTWDYDEKYWTLIIGEK